MHAFPSGWHDVASVERWSVDRTGGILITVKSCLSKDSQRENKQMKASELWYPRE